MTSGLLTWGLALALGMSLAGVTYRVVTWFRRSAGQPPSAAPLPGRGWSAVRGAVRALRRARPASLVRVLVAEIALQSRLWRRDRVRWLAHAAIVVGLVALILLHALDGVTTARWVSGYEPTLSPWPELRDGLGVLVIAGVMLSALRRRAARRSLPRLRRRDPLLLGLVVGVIVTGVALKATQIISAPSFYRMAEDYSSASAEELEPLRALWADAFGVVFTDRPIVRDAETEALGQELHEESCVSCHGSPRQLIASYPLSRAAAPAAAWLAGVDAARGLWHLHVILCLVGLVYLPWRRLFHLVAGPASLLADAAAPAAGDDGLRATRRALALDACVRCGLCDERCSVRPLQRLYANENVLPSAKLLALRRVATGTATSDAELALIAEGALACTDCGRCTAGCPLGLDLADLWAEGKRDLAARGQTPIGSWIRGAPAGVWAERLAAAPESPRLSTGVPVFTSLTHDRRTFSPCVQCQTCTNVCPVVAHSTGEGWVDATPQKVMNLLRLGLSELALGSRMVWDCTTCYQCQEHCPAGIRVTEVLYELRNRGYARLGALRRTEQASSPQGGAV